MQLGVLFCDQVGSTALLTRLGDALAEEVRRDLFQVLYRAASLCRGEVIKSSGDGLMVVFPSGADDALACGELMLAMVGRLARRELWSDVRFKVGVSAGDAVFDKGDWYGAAVNLAARLCAAAEPGQILASTATLAAARTDTSGLAGAGEPDLERLPRAGRGRGPECRQRAGCQLADAHLAGHARDSRVRRPAAGTRRAAGLLGLVIE